VLSPQGAARAVGEESIKALVQCAGADAVKIFDSRTYQKAFASLLSKPDETMVVDLLNHALVVQCLDFKTTHLLVLALCPVTLFTLNLLRNQGITTTHWFYEDYRQALYWKTVLPGYHYFFAIQKGPLVHACAAQKTRYVFLPTAASSAMAVVRPAGSAAGADVAFIGIPSPYRIGILEFLALQGIRLAIAGSGWNSYRGLLEQFIVNGKWTNAQHMATILSNATIGLNLSTMDPKGDRENSHISPRVFDMLQAGCALVTEEVPLIHEILIDCAFYTFLGHEQALGVIKEVLSHPERERDRAEKNWEMIRTRHTYEHRVREIMSLTKGSTLKSGGHPLSPSMREKISFPPPGKSSNKWEDKGGVK
jgi:hypothetical protein